MKRAAVILLLLFPIFFGCETERILFTGPNHVRFSEAALSTKESNTQILSIEVHLVGPALTDDLTIFYSISGSARENVDYRILETRESFTIKKGKYFGVIQVQLINNSNNIIRSQDLQLNLTATSDSNISVGQGEGGIGKKYILTIVDDCILGGSYTGSRGSVTAPVTITSSDCEKYTVSNWNINVFSSTTVMNLILIDNADNTLTIPEQEEENISEEFATIKGNGVVDPVTGTIILNVTLVDFTDQPTFTITYNRN